MQNKQLKITTESQSKPKGLRLAFTLAEVLIVVGIIGIIAEMTIPTLVANVNENAYKSAWKKNYAVFNSVVISIMQDNNGTLAGALGPGEYVDHYEIRDVFFNYLNWTRKCNGGESAQNRCFPYPIYALTGAEITGWAYLLEGSGQLKDGTSVMFVKGNNACNPTHFCGEVTIDVNGLKKPNTIGKDIYAAKILFNRLVPLGSPYVLDYDYTDPGEACDPKIPGANGDNCAFDYLFK